MEIAGLYARDLERGRAVAEPYGCPVYDSVDELLSKVEIADNCLPTFLHQSDASGRRPRQDATSSARNPWRLATTREKRSSAIVMQRRYASLSPWWCVSSRSIRAVWEKVRKGELGQVKEITLKRVVSPPPPRAPGFWTIVSPAECSAI